MTCGSWLAVTVVAQNARCILSHHRHTPTPNTPNTKCTVHVSVLDQGEIVATGAANAGPANVASDRDQALSSMQAATEFARQQAGIDADTQIDLMVAAVAGASRCDATELANQISSVVNAGRTSVVADVSVLFAAAKITGPAVDDIR